MKGFYRLYALGGALAALVTSIGVQADPMLSNLNSGAVLRTKAPIVIRANNVLEPLSSEGSRSLNCFLRMKHAESYDRVVPQDREFLVTDVRRGAVSAKGYVASYTTVFLASGSVDSILCSREKNPADPSLEEFSRAIGKVLTLDISGRPAEVP